MCGIAGKIIFDGIISEQEIIAMSNKIAHRGPDDSGAYISPDRKVGLGHQRLSIIDLSSKGHQPMPYLNRYWIVFNGEIYNFQTEKKELIKEGYKFSSETDTEVILALYDRYKEGCLSHLRGMFSFAIYDEKEQMLFCARDRIGKKPFKYFFNGRVFIFASELKAILTQPQYKKEADYNDISDYLTYQYVPSPKTGFKNIYKLEPAHYLTVDLKRKKVAKERYYRLDFSKKLDLSENEWIKRIKEGLEEAVKIRLISDVPLGAFLSGGVDSSIIVAVMSKLMSSPVRTFSIGFEEQDFDELKYARVIAKLFKTDHTEFIVKPDTVEILPKLVRQYEEPYADSSALPTYYLSELTRKHVTVALNGDGGDENFAGYGRYSIYKILNIVDKISLLNRSIVSPACRLFRRIFKTHFLNSVCSILSSAEPPYAERYAGLVSYFNNDSKMALFTGDFKEILGPVDSYEILEKKFLEAAVGNKMDRLFYADIASYLPDDLLVKVDIATMAFSLEGRSPFLDNKFMKLTAQMPDTLKLKGFYGNKYILKKAFSDLIPKDILYRPKMGFGLPIREWFRKELKDFVSDTILSRKAVGRNIFNKSYLERLLNEHKMGINHDYQIWALLTLEFWFREFFD
ncbi:MAG: asparagine synthase (glutamine-hydrolyzing) [Candidatus Margulisiibacteriota bacterium]